MTNGVNIGADAIGELTGKKTKDPGNGGSVDWNTFVTQAPKYLKAAFELNDGEDSRAINVYTNILAVSGQPTENGEFIHFDPSTPAGLTKVLLASPIAKMIQSVGELYETEVTGSRDPVNILRKQIREVLFRGVEKLEPIQKETLEQRVQAEATEEKLKGIQDDLENRGEVTVLDVSNFVEAYDKWSQRATFSSWPQVDLDLESSNYKASIGKASELIEFTTEIEKRTKDLEIVKRYAIQKRAALNKRQMAMVRKCRTHQAHAINHRGMLLTSDAGLRILELAGGRDPIDLPEVVIQLHRSNADSHPLLEGNNETYLLPPGESESEKSGPTKNALTNHFNMKERMQLNKNFRNLDPNEMQSLLGLAREACDATGALADAEDLEVEIQNVAEKALVNLYDPLVKARIEAKEEALAEAGRQIIDDRTKSFWQQKGILAKTGYMLNALPNATGYVAAGLIALATIPIFPGETTEVNIVDGKPVIKRVYETQSLTQKLFSTDRALGDARYEVAQARQDVTESRDHLSSEMENVTTGISAGMKRLTTGIQGTVNKEVGAVTSRVQDLEKTTRDVQRVTKKLYTAKVREQYE